MRLQSSLKRIIAKRLAGSRAETFGVLRFGYEGFSAFDRKLQSNGAYDVNLGDNAQSIAARNLLKMVGVGDNQIVIVNRDTLPSYSGPPCSLVMNAVFFEQSFPLPSSIRPIFIGFQAGENVIRQNLSLFKLHEPIGCRDIATTERMQSLGVNAFTTGCITLTLSQRATAPDDGRFLIVYGWDFPSSVLARVPKDLMEKCEFIYHRLPVDEYPVSVQTCQTAEAYEKSLFERYRQTAKLVLTPLHHVAAPCLAMGIPVIVCRSNYDDRFSFLRTLTPIYTPEHFPSIDWSPVPVDVSGVKHHIKEILSAALNTAPTL